MTINPRLDSLRRKVLKAVGMAGIDLPVVNDRGQRQIVVALEEESFSLLMQRLRNAGGYANVFVETSKGLVSVSVIKQECSLASGSCEHIDMPISSSSDVGMFLNYLEQHPEGVAVTMKQDDPVHQGVATDVREVDSILI